jgi:hypothetical protein
VRRGKVMQGSCKWETKLCSDALWCWVTDRHFDRRTSMERPLYPIQ